MLPCHSHTCIACCFPVQGLRAGDQLHPESCVQAPVQGTALRFFSIEVKAPGIQKKKLTHTLDQKPIRLSHHLKTVCVCCVTASSTQAAYTSGFFHISMYACNILNFFRSVYASASRCFFMPKMTVRTSACACICMYVCTSCQLHVSHLQKNCVHALTCMHVHVFHTYTHSHEESLVHLHTYTCTHACIVSHKTSWRVAVCI